MSSADVPLREVVKRLGRRVDALGMTLGQLAIYVNGNDRVKIVDTYLTVEAGDYSRFDLLVVLSDYNEESGLFRRNDATTKPTDGSAAIQDAVGAKYERIVYLT